MIEAAARLTDEMIYYLNCLSYRAVHGRVHQPGKVLVNGSPKTGTTWMLKMVISIPGYHKIGNFHNDIQKFKTLHAGDVVHGHHRYTPELAQILDDQHVKVILTVRDPRDQLISRVFHVRREPTHIWNEQFKTMSLDESIMACIEGRQDLPSMRAMTEISLSWLNDKSKVMFVRYEDLLQNPVEQFRCVLQHLQIKVSDSLIKKIVERNQFSRLTVGRKFWQSGRSHGSSDPHSHFRKGISGDWKNHFKPEHIERFKELMGDKLIELGYEQDFNWNNS
jgi:hypothetical protein